MTKGLKLMTYTLRRYKSYQEYLDDDELQPERNYRLLDTGEVIEVSSENDDNLWLASVLILLLQKTVGLAIIKLIRNGNKEIQVNPFGDGRVNRKPDLLVMQPEHRQDKQAIKLGVVPPAFVAEVVSPGSESSDNYLRDYVWKRQQYQEWGIPEYWILDAHREQVTVLVLVDGEYEEMVYQGDRKIVSKVYPEIDITAGNLLAGKV